MFEKLLQIVNKKSSGGKTGTFYKHIKQYILPITKPYSKAVWILL
jgi:hypothetical protein